MPKGVEYRYILYDEHGIHYTSVFGTSNKAIVEDLRHRGWTGIGFGNAKLNDSIVIRKGERISKVYGRDRTKEKREDQFRHLYIVRQQLATIGEDTEIQILNLDRGEMRRLLGLEYVPFRRPDLIGI